MRMHPECLHSVVAGLLSLGKGSLRVSNTLIFRRKVLRASKGGAHNFIEPHNNFP